jgi:formylglycine-generating enzyme required for sulfatase activity
MTDMIAPLRDGMIAVDGGRFLMGSDRHYPEEGPAHEVHVDAFWIDATPVTNRDFAAFVAATGYVTVAETPPDPADYPGLLPEMMQAGSLVFSPPSHAVPLNNPSAWWSFEFGADWRHPLGPNSSLDGLDDHPVVHIAYADAAAYAAWAGKALPTEAEFECAARGGLVDQDYAWGDTLDLPDGTIMANYWQGPFPHGNSLADGWLRTSPVRSFPANGFGLFDMIGNVWEWTDDWFADQHEKGDCCVPRNPRGAKVDGSYDPCIPEIPIGRKVLKGGSHLCAPSYCHRYRPAARWPQPVDTSTSHVGFRCVVRGA